MRERRATRRPSSARSRTFCNGFFARQPSAPAPAREEAVKNAIEADAATRRRASRACNAPWSFSGLTRSLKAEALFREVAEDKAKRIKRDSKDAAAAYRNLGVIAGLGDPKRALDAYRKAFEFDPDDVEPPIGSAGSNSGRGGVRAPRSDVSHESVDGASRWICLLSVLGAAWFGGHPTDLRRPGMARAHNTRQPLDRRPSGEVRPRQRRLAARPVDLVRQIGDVLVAQGNLPEALKASAPRSPSSTVWRSPTPATPAGSATCRCRTTRSATCWWRRATCRRR